MHGIAADRAHLQQLPLCLRPQAQFKCGWYTLLVSASQSHSAKGPYGKDLSPMQGINLLKLTCMYWKVAQNFNMCFHVFGSIFQKNCVITFKFPKINPEFQHVHPQFSLPRAFIGPTSAPIKLEWCYHKSNWGDASNITLLLQFLLFCAIQIWFYGNVTTKPNQSNTKPFVSCHRLDKGARNYWAGHPDLVQGQSHDCASHTGGRDA